MAVRKDARPNPSANKPATYSRRWFLQRDFPSRSLVSQQEGDSKPPTICPLSRLIPPKFRGTRCPDMMDQWPMSDAFSDPTSSKQGDSEAKFSCHVAAALCFSQLQSYGDEGKVTSIIYSIFLWRGSLLYLPFSHLLQHKKETVKRLTKKVEKLRAKFNLMKELHEKDKAEVEEKEREYAQGRRWNDLALKEDACVRRGIDITLDLIDAQDEGDRVRANGLMQSLRELVSEHIGEKVALVSAVQE